MFAPREILKKKVLKTIYKVGGFRPFHYLNRNALLILTYHRFSENGGTHSVSRKKFSEHLAYLKKHSNVITLDDAISAHANQDSLPANSVVITIDDGYGDAYEVAAPVLDEFKMPATIYVITGFLNGSIWLWTDLMRFLIKETGATKLSVGEEAIERIAGSGELEFADRVNTRLKTLDDSRKWEEIKRIFDEFGLDVPSAPTTEYAPLSWNQAREMDSAGIAVECHTVNHPILPNVGIEVVRKELGESKLEIESQIGKECRHFCYPNGSFGDREAEIAKEVGFVTAVTTNYGFVDSNADPFRLKRIDGNLSIANFAQSVSGFESMREKIGI